MKVSAFPLLLVALLAAGDVLAQAQPEARRVLDQASAVLALAQSCPQHIDKA